MPKKKTGKITKALPFNRVQVLLLILVLAIVGVVIVYKSHAATNAGWVGMMSTFNCKPVVLGFPATLQQGSTGGCVEFLQFILETGRGKLEPLDGIFGPKTRGYVVSFQSQNGLTTDGIVGPKTWLKLDQCFNDLSPTIKAIWVCKRIPS